MRVAHLPMGKMVLVGPMAVSPEDLGFDDRFTGFRLEWPAEVGLPKSTEAVWSSH